MLCSNSALLIRVLRISVDTLLVFVFENSFNMLFSSRGQNPLHALAIYSKDNSAAIFELFRQNRPEYSFNAVDAEENTGKIINHAIFHIVHNSLRSLLDLRPHH